MTRDDIIRLAREAGAMQQESSRALVFQPTDIERFAELVAAEEREACAQVCEEQAGEPECPERAQYCADAIRARGQQ